MAQFTVTNIVDGDTFDVQGWKWENQQGSRIRPTGYDAPEMNTISGVMAKNKLEKLILGKNVEITQAHTIDRGRLVADVYYNGRPLAEYFSEYKC